MLHWHADVVASPIDRKMAVLYNLYRPWEFLLLKKADRIIATSDAYLNSSKPLTGFKRKTRIIPLGINPNRLIDTRTGRRAGAANAGFKVLAVGRFAYYKGFEYLVQAAEKAPDARFIMVGDGPRYPEIKKRVWQKGLQGRVQLPGRVSADRLRELFLDCDLFCLPSVERTEAFGMVLLEAMSLGKPLVTTKISGSGVSEVNVDGVTGLQVPPGDAEALANTLSNLQHNPDMRLKMGVFAQKRFDERFHICSVVAQTTELYREVIKTFNLGFTQ